MNCRIDVLYAITTIRVLSRPVRSDETPEQDPVAVITYDYWQRPFSGSNAAVGTVMRVSDVPITIVGVTRPGFECDIVGERIDVWLPLMMQPLIQGLRDYCEIMIC